MSRMPQGKASTGSQKWLQVLVNERPELLARALVTDKELAGAGRIEWLSPLANDDFAEYRDAAFLRRLGVQPARKPLDAFWPRQGPVWDGLGRTERGDLLLVEAKAHIGELVSSASQAAAESRTRIEDSLAATKRYLKIKNTYDWTGRFYQYTNRLAHLYFLWVLNHLPAYLVLVYFIGAQEVGGPETREEWDGALQLLHGFLGVERHAFSSTSVRCSST